jgi:hypothetical protein
LPADRSLVIKKLLSLTFPEFRSTK